MNGLKPPNLHFTVSSGQGRGSLCYEGYFHKFQEAPTEKSEFVLCELIFPAMREVSSARKCQSINMNDFHQTCRKEMLEIPKEKSPHLALQEKQSATGPSQSAPPHITRLLGRGFKGVDMKGVIYSQFYPPTWCLRARPGWPRIFCGGSLAARGRGPGSPLQARLLHNG